MATTNVRRGFENHRLQAATLCFSPAGPEAAANPPDLRLRHMKVRGLLLLLLQDFGCCARASCCTHAHSRTLHTQALLAWA
jgi:hypothetical protein